MGSETASTNRASHWDTVYGTREESQLSWHQDDPALSLSLIREFCPPGGRIIDVGGGSSLLACRLVEAGYQDVAVLDVSESALRAARKRCGDPARRVRWMVSDATAPAGSPQEPYDLWHDRAAFHFLVDPRDRRRYVDRAAASVKPGGHAIIATFAPEGPPQCSGLPVRRYDAAGLAREFAPAFALVRPLVEKHVTPWGKEQAFVYAVLRRAG